MVDAVRVGGSRSTGVGVVKAGVTIMVLSILLGPGAAMSAVWYWVETKLFRVGKDARRKAV